MFRARELTSGDARATAPVTYETYYGFAEPPFSLTPGLRFAYRSHAYTSALNEVRLALERREGLIVLSGEIGMGKTMLCRALLQESDIHTFVSLILDPCLSAEEMLAQILDDFGVLDRDQRPGRSVAPAPRHQMLLMLQRFLASLLPLGARAVVVVDEAQHLHPAVLEQIRLWSNFETEDTKLLQIVLAGQPELDELLQRREMRQILQRVSRRCEVTQLRREEIPEYLEHRLTVARGRSGEQPASATNGNLLAHSDFWRVSFTPAAARAVAELSRGIPRLVNLLADRALEVGCHRQAKTIDARMVRVAARRLNLLTPAVPRRAIGVAVAAAAVVLLVLLPLAWRSHGVRPPDMAAAPPATEAIAGTTDAVAATSGSRVDATFASAPAPRPLAVQDSVNVRIAVFRTEQRAEAVAAQLVDAGFPAFTRRDPASAWHQVIVGPFVSGDEAAAAQRALEAQGVTGADVRLENVMASDARANRNGR